MDNIAKIRKNTKDLEILNNIGKGLAKLFDVGEKDPLSMTDEEFDNLCDIVTVHKAQIGLMKETIASAEDVLYTLDGVLLLAKIIRGKRE